MYSVCPISNQAALQAHRIEVAQRKMGNELECIAGLPAQAMAYEMDKVARRHEGNAARSIRQIKGISKATDGELLDKLHACFNAPRAARGKEFDTYGKLLVKYFPRKWPVVSLGFYGGGFARMVPFDLTLYLRFVQTAQVIVHFVNMSGIHVAAAA